LKISKLDLIAYGHFTNISLDFNTGSNKFHIIYGANEAGKSTILRALNGFFYGIPKNTGDSFLHDNNKLRIGAVLEKSSGEEVELIRRKGNKNTLLDSAGNPVDEGIIRNFLDGVEQDIFKTMFGLDHRGLTQGGEDLLSGGGKVGESLFAVVSGGKSLQEIIGEMENEASQIFKSGGSKPELNILISEYKKVKKEIQNSSVAAREWEAKEQELIQNRAALGKIIEKMREKQKEMARMQRIKRSLPKIAQRQEKMDRLEAMGSVIILPESFKEERIEIFNQLKHNRESLKKAQTEKKRLLTEIEASKVSAGVLKYRVLITSLLKRLENYVKYCEELPAGKADVQRLEKELNSILAELDPSLSPEDARNLQIPLVLKEKIKELDRKYKPLLSDVQNAQEQDKKCSLEVKEKQAEIDKCEKPADAEKLKVVVDNAQKLGDIEKDFKQTADEVIGIEKQCLVDIQKMGRWQGTLDEMEKLSLPLLESIDCYNDEYTDLNAEWKNVSKDIDKTKEQIRKYDAELKHLEILEKIPTEDELKEARTQRERGWLLVRKSWLDREPDIQAEKEFDPNNPLDIAYEYSVINADETSDYLRRDAQSVARKTGLLLQKEEANMSLETSFEYQNELRTKFEDFNKRWIKLWAPAGVQPLTPREMRGWLEKANELIKQAGSIRKDRLKMHSLKEKIEHHKGKILAVMEKTGEKSVDISLSLAELINQGKKLIQKIDSQNINLQKLEDSLKERQKNLHMAGEKLLQVNAKLGLWQSTWQELMEKLNLDPAASPEIVMTILEKREQIFLKQTQIADKQLINTQQEEYIASFDKEIDKLLDELNMEREKKTSSEIVDNLSNMLSQAEIVVRNRENVKLRGDEINEYYDIINKAESQLEKMLQQAACKDYTELEKAENSSSELLKLKEKLKNLDEQLVTDGEGLGLKEIIAEGESATADLLKVKLAEIGDELKALEDKRSVLDGDVRLLEEQLKKMDGSSDAAAEAAFRAQSLLTVMKEKSKEFMRLQLAIVLIRKAIEEYRERNQGSIIEKTGQIFSALTLNSFSGVKVGFNDNDEAILMGIRTSTGEGIEVHAMSDGSCDQLYLSLCLASIEQHLDNKEAVPLILDDLLINFDDQRAREALKVLGQFTSKTQILFFTHHSRLLELAQEVLPAEDLVIHNI